MHRVVVGGGNYAIGRVEVFTFRAGHSVRRVLRVDFLRDSRWLGDCFSLSLPVIAVWPAVAGENSIRPGPIGVCPEVP